MVRIEVDPRERGRRSAVIEHRRSLDSELATLRDRASSLETMISEAPRLLLKVRARIRQIERTKR